MKYVNLLGKTLALSWKASKKHLLWLFMVNIVVGISSPVTTFIASKQLDSLVQVFQAGNLRPVMYWTIFQVAFIFIISCVSKVCAYHQEVLEDHMKKYITNVVLCKTETMSLSDFDDPVIYNQINKINTEAPNRSVGLLNSLVTITQAVIGLLGYFAIFMSYNIWVIPIAIIAYIPIYWVNIKISLKMHEVFSSRIEKNRLLQMLQALLLRYDNIKELKTFDVSRHIRRRINNTYDEYIIKDSHLRSAHLIKKTWISLIELGSQLGFKIYFILDAIKKSLGVGTVIMYINSIERLMNNIQIIMMMMTSMYQNNLYVETLFEFEEKSFQDNKSEKIICDFEIETIVFDQVSFCYPNQSCYILQDINLKIDKAKSYLLVGLNGSGKTTLIKLLAKLYSPTTGRILINGIDLETIDTKSYQKSLSVVFQDFIKYPLDVTSNIKMGDFEKGCNDSDIRDSALMSGAADFIERLPYHYQTVLQKEWTNGTEISLGQWQKIAISRAYYANSPIIIMDEPAASLDAVAENELYKTISNILEQKTCIMISHRFLSAKLVDYIIVLENSRICEFGSFDELMEEQGKFSKLFELQAQKYDTKISS